MADKMCKMYIAFFLLLPSFCYSRITNLPAECNFRTQQRVECGWSGISAFKCRSKGCCWDDTKENSIFCFKLDERQTRRGARRMNNFNDPFSPMVLLNSGEKSSVRTCLVRQHDRVQCGWKTISTRMCENRGCCYDKTSRSVPMCYNPGNLLIGSRIRTLLHCTWQCSRTYWKRISGGYSLCGTNNRCWIDSVGFSAASCFVACKIKHDFSIYLSKVTRCLNLDNETSTQTIRVCATHIPCWIEYHGQTAFTCFQKFDEIGQDQSTEIPENTNKEDLLPLSKSSAVIPRQPIPTENIFPKEEGLIPKVAENFNFPRTGKDVERSVYNQQFINEKEDGGHKIEHHGKGPSLESPHKT